ncbi:MAG TPA: tetratricopeptide repeat protein [Drouetiella sp.]|jgi:tetratricopeptide (TPR) repeat protein
MSAQTLATTLLSTQRIMGDVMLQPQLVLDRKTLEPSSQQFLSDLRTIAQALITEAEPGDEKTLHRIGVACRLMGDFELAKVFYIKALELSSGSAGADSLQAATHRNFLAGLYFAWQKFESARALVEQSLATYQKFLGEQHMHTKLTHFALALIHTKLGDAQLARRHFDESALKNLKVPDQAESTNHWLNLNFRIISLAAMKFEQKQFDESYELFRYCIITEANEAWPGSMVVARSLQNLALLCRAQSMNLEAEEFFKMTLQMKKDIIGTEHSDYLSTQSQYRDLLRYMGKAVV